MSILKKNAKKKETTSVITARIPTELYSKFKNYCIQYGVSINEALNLLVENEVNSIQNVYKNEEENDSEVEEEKPSETEEKPKQKPQGSGLTPEQWQELARKANRPQWEIEEEEKFEWVQDKDAQGNLMWDENNEPVMIRIAKAEHLYGKIEERKQEIDPNNPIEKMLRKFEEDWK